MSENTEKEPNDVEKKLQHAKQFLVFMVSFWDDNIKPTKRVVARYSVGSGNPSSFLTFEIPKIITTLYRHIKE